MNAATVQYTSIRGLFRLEAPERWPLATDDAGIVSISSPSGKAAVTVSAGRHSQQSAVIDACETLRQYVDGLDIEQDQFREIACSANEAAGEYVDKQRVYWRIMFKTSGSVVVFGSYNREAQDPLEHEDREAGTILASIEIVAK